MKKFLKKYLLWLCLAAVMLGTLLFILCPRRMASLAVSDHAPVTQVTVYFHANDVDQDIQVVLTEQQTAELLAAMEQTRCFLRPFGKGYNNGGEDALNCTVLFRYATPTDALTPLLYVSSSRCVLVDGARYACYSTQMTDYLQTLRP